MNETVSSLDLHFMIREFQDMIGARIDKVYHKKDELALQLYSTVTKKVFLFFKLPSTTFLINKKPDTEEIAGGFCMFLRKKLAMGRIEKVEQVGFERIMKIFIDNKGEKFELIVELFSPGNFLLVQEGKILSMQNSLNTKDRVVRGGIEYKPLIRDFDALNLKEEEIVEVFAKSDKESVVKLLALDLGFGGVYAEEICSVAKIDKDSKDLSVDEIKKIHKTIKKLNESEIKPVFIQKDVYPFQLKSLDKGELLDKSFSRSVGDRLIDRFVSEKIESEKKSQNNNLKKIESIIEKQKKQIDTLEKDAEILQKKGELIYENYSSLEELLKTINDAKKKYSYKEIKEKLKEKELIKDLNEKEQSIIIELIK